MVRVELAVASQAVQQPLDVRPENAVQVGVVDLVEMLAQAVPEVKGDLHNLQTEPGQDHANWTSTQNIGSVDKPVWTGTVPSDPNRF